MRVAAVQFRPKRDPLDLDGAVSGNRAGLLALAAERLSQGPVDLLVLPEMAASGYLYPSAEALGRIAESDDGPTVTAVASLARDHGCHVVVGFPERSAGRLYNSAAIVDGHGELVAVYRKRFLYEADVPWATPGDGPYPVADTGSGRFTVGICMDLNADAFTGWVRHAAVEAVAFPTNWVDEGEPVWPYWAWRLQGARAALVAANRWGGEDVHGAMVDGPTDRDAGVTSFSGASCVLQWRRHGGRLRPTVLAALPPRGDGSLAATV